MLTSSFEIFKGKILEAFPNECFDSPKGYIWEAMTPGIFHSQFQRKAKKAHFTMLVAITQTPDGEMHGAIMVDDSTIFETNGERVAGDAIAQVQDVLSLWR